MAVVLDIFDAYGNRGASIGGQRVTGPAKGYRNLRYTPRGACIDKAGTLSFEVPMTIRNNAPLTVGATIQVTDSRWGDQGLFIVDDKSETVADNGHWAAFTCLDVVEELRWQTVPGFTALPNEPTSATLARLLGIQGETAWSGSLLDNTDGFQNVGFQAENVTIQQAVDKLLTDRFLHWRRGAGRVIEAGTFKHATGIRLVRPSARPAAMNRPAIRPIAPGGFTLKADAATLVNCIVPVGAGSGWAQLTLQPLFNAQQYYIVQNGWHQSAPLASPFVGYDPAYPIMRRIRYDGGGLDGYQYFLIDPASIVTYRQRWLPYPRTDIGAISNSVGDLTNAAAALYQTGLAYLKWHLATNQTLSVVTDGRGNNVGVGGNTVRVEYLEVVAGATTLNVKGDYVAMDCERAVDDTTGAMTDTWTVSSLGRENVTDAGVVAGALESIEQLRVGPMVYPVERDIHRDQPVDANNPVVVHVNLHTGVQRVVEATFSVQLLPIYSTVAGGQVAAHSHTVQLPGTPVNASVPYTYEGGYNPTGQAAYGHAAPGGQFNHGHSDSITATKGGGVTNAGIPNVTNAFNTHYHTMLIVGGGNPGTGDNSGIVYVTNTGRSGLQTVGNHQVQASTDPGIGYGSTDATHGHSDTIGVTKGGGVTANPGYTPSVNAHSGFQPDSRFPGYTNVPTISYPVQTSSTIAPVWNPIYGMYFDPAGRASGVTVRVNGAVAYGPFSVDQVGLNLAPYLTGTAPVDITFTSATLGRLVIEGTVRAAVTTYAVGK